MVILAAIVTTFAVFKKNNLYPEMGSYEMPMDAEMGAGISGDQGLFSSDDATPRTMEKNLAIEPDFGAEPAIDQRTIKNGNLTLKVERLSEAQEKITEIAASNGGNVFSTNISRSKSDIRSGTVTVRVPVANFEKTFEEVKKVATIVVRESTSGQDVTEEYLDLEARVKNKKTEEESYTRILNQAQKIEDILAITQQISNVRGEIESLEGQIKYLTSQTDMSTIIVNMSEDQEITATDSWRPFQIVKEAVNSLVKNLQGFVNFLIVSAIVFIPVVALYALVLYMVFLLGRKIYRKFKKDDKLTE